MDLNYRFSTRNVQKYCPYNDLASRIQCSIAENVLLMFWIPTSNFLRLIQVPQSYFPSFHVEKSSNGWRFFSSELHKRSFHPSKSKSTPVDDVFFHRSSIVDPLHTFPAGQRRKPGPNTRLSIELAHTQNIINISIKYLQQITEKMYLDFHNNAFRSFQHQYPPSPVIYPYLIESDPLLVHLNPCFLHAAKPS